MLVIQLKLHVRVYVLKIPILPDLCKIFFTVCCLSAANQRQTDKEKKCVRKMAGFPGREYHENTIISFCFFVSIPVWNNQDHNQLSVVFSPPWHSVELCAYSKYYYRQSFIHYSRCDTNSLASKAFTHDKSDLSSPCNKKIFLTIYTPHYRNTVIQPKID